MRLAAHVPTVNGAAVNDPSGAPGDIVPPRSFRNDDEILGLIEEVNKIYFPYGIRFVPDAAIDRAGVLDFTHQGFMHVLTGGVQSDDRSNRVNGAVNMYFVPQIQFDDTTVLNHWGGAANSARGAPRTFGSIITDVTVTGQAVAHELGHVLNLVKNPGYTHVNTVQDATMPGTGRDVSGRHRLPSAADVGIHRFRPIDRVWDTVHDVGYDIGNPGSMLTVKNLDGDPTDDEMAEVGRTAARLGAPPRP